MFDPSYQRHTRSHRMRYHKQTHYAPNDSVQEESICMSSDSCYMSLLQRRCISRYRYSVMYIHLMSFSGCTSELMDACWFCVCARVRVHICSYCGSWGWGGNESLCENVIWYRGSKRSVSSVLMCVRRWREAYFEVKVFSWKTVGRFLFHACLHHPKKGIRNTYIKMIVMSI